MKHPFYFLVLLLFFSCQEQHKKNTTTSNSLSKEISNTNKVLFSSYATAEDGLNYREKPNINSEILGKIDYGSKVDIVDNKNYLQFSVDDEKRGYLAGKWTGIKKDSSVVYVFDAYLFKSSPAIEEHIKLIHGKLEVIYTEEVNINSNMKMIIEKHIQTSNHLADYVLIKLEKEGAIIFEHEIKYLFKEEYTLTKTKNTIPTYKYVTIFDECPSSEYNQLFSIKGNRIIIIDEAYYEAVEE